MINKSSVKKRRLYYFTQSQWATEDIVLKRLKISDIKDLNDPYELTGYIVNVNKKKVKNEFKEDISDKYGIICFSNSYHSMLMWSHYADKHRGICLGFDICEDDCFDVIYSESMTNFQNNFNTPSTPFTLKDLQGILSLKYREWAYEEECRIYSPFDSSISHSGFNFEQFGERLQLREVIFGVQNNTEPATLIRFIEQYYEGNIKISKAALDSNKFRVNIADATCED